MPIFRFKCKACGGEFEVLSRYGDAAPACLSCGSTQVEKCLNVVGAIKGGASGCRAAATCPAATAHCCQGGGCGCKHE